MSGIHVERRDLVVPVPLQAIHREGSGATVGRDAAGQYFISGPTAATTYRFGIPLNSFGGAFPTGGSPSTDKHGFRLDEILLWYIIGAVDATADTIALISETMTGGATRAAGTTFGGTLAYYNNDASAAGLATVFSANAYLSRVVLGTPVYLGTLGQIVTAEWVVGTGAASGTVKVLGVALKGRQGFQA